MDAETVAAAARGESRAQAEVARRVGPRLFSLAARLGCGAAEAEDLVEEALYRGLVKLKELRDPGALGAWFARILVNLWRDGLRRRGRDLLLLDDLPERAAPAADGPEARAEAGELGERVAAAIVQLPPAQRAVLALHLEQGLSVAETASALATTPERVKANLWHARRRLRELLGDLLGERPVTEAEP